MVDTTNGGQSNTGQGGTNGGGGSDDWGPAQLRQTLESIHNGLAALPETLVNAQREAFGAGKTEGQTEAKTEGQTEAKTETKTETKSENNQTQPGWLEKLMFGGK